MKKKIISKTITFIEIVLAIIIFKSIFGENNSLVGVSIVIGTLVLMSVNLTINPVKNFLLFFAIYISLGLGSFIANNSAWLGLTVNFVILASVGYFFSYNLTKTMVVPFGLGYLFMLYTPVYGVDFIKRLIALALAPVSIMVAQYIIYGRTKKVEIKESSILEFEKEDEEYKNIRIFNKNIKINVIRAAYAIRMSLLITIVAFIDYMVFRKNNITEGRWMLYTIFSVTEIYTEHCKVKSKKRFQGTLLGSLIVLVLFIIIKSDALRVLIMLVAGYIDSYLDDYRDSMICVTISAVTSVAISKGALAMVFQRILFVLLGISVALIGSKFLFKDTKCNAELEK